MQIFAAALIALLSQSYVPAQAQRAGNLQPETHPAMTMEECSSDGCKPSYIDITLDMSWRWLHNQGGYDNCVDDDTGMWDARFCPDAHSCAENCEVEGLDLDAYATKYGVSANEHVLQLQYIPGSRVYALQAGQYKLFKLKNREFSVEVDVSSLGCGINAALYFVEMPVDGGPSGAGADLGAGYCDAQCPRHIKFIDGIANTQGWAKKTVKNPDGREVEVGPEGRFGACCAEMDVFEANREAQVLTAHPCSLDGPRRCDGPKECGDKELQEPGVCDKDGCGYNSYRLGARSFYGKGDSFDVDTSKPVTLVTQFLTADGTDDGELTEIRRIWVQDGKIVRNSDAGLLGAGAGNSITQDLCDAQVDVFNASEDQFTRHGGLKAMGDALGRGMVLAMSIWDDGIDRMLWLDAEETSMKEKGKLGAARGPCDFASGDVAATKEENAKAFVVFKNLRLGEINATFPADLPVKEPKPAMILTITTTTTTATETPTTKTTRTTSTKTTTAATTDTTTTQSTITKTTTTTTETTFTKTVITTKTTLTTSVTVTQITTTREAKTTTKRTHAPRTPADAQTAQSAEADAAIALDADDNCGAIRNCNLREPGRACQCDPGCVAYRDCCVDALKVCLQAWTMATGNLSFMKSQPGTDKVHMSFADAGQPDAAEATQQRTKKYKITKSSTSSKPLTSAATTTSTTHKTTRTKSTLTSFPITTSKVTATTSTTTAEPTAKKHSHAKQEKHQHKTDDTQDASTTQGGEHETLEPFCCMAAGDKNDVCATCLPAAQSSPSSDNWCGANESRCDDCGKVWCRQGSETLPNMYKASQEKAASTNGAGSCEEYGCGDFDSSQACQCYDDCEDFGDCCPDVRSTCSHDAGNDIIMKDTLVRDDSLREVGHARWALVATCAAAASLLAVLLVIPRSVPGMGRSLHMQVGALSPWAHAADRREQQALMAEA